MYNTDNYMYIFADTIKLQVPLPVFAVVLVADVLSHCPSLPLLSPLF